jgi:Flp pilus assembly pilin Flp
MKTTPPKLSKALKNLFREENQRLVEFFLLIALISFATTLSGLGMMSKVDHAFSSVGTTLTSFTK